MNISQGTGNALQIMTFTINIPLHSGEDITDSTLINECTVGISETLNLI